MEKYESNRLYVGCGLTQAPESFRLEVETFKNRLREDFEVLDFVGLNDAAPEDVYRWDIERCVATCDMFVAICDYPSIGLGWELCEAARLGKKILGFAHQDATVTKLLIGAAAVLENVTFNRYLDLVNDVPPVVRLKA